MYIRAVSEAFPYLRSPVDSRAKFQLVLPCFFGFGPISGTASSCYLITSRDLSRSELPQANVLAICSTKDRSFKINASGGHLLIYIHL